MVSGILMCKDGDTNEKKLIIGGVFTLISVMSIFTYLVFKGIFIPNQISVDKYEIKGVDVASYQGI